MGNKMAPSGQAEKGCVYFGSRFPLPRVLGGWKNRKLIQVTLFALRDVPSFYGNAPLAVFLPSSDAAAMHTPRTSKETGSRAKIDSFPILHSLLLCQRFRARKVIKITKSMYKTLFRQKSLTHTKFITIPLLRPTLLAAACSKCNLGKLHRTWEITNGIKFVFNVSFSYKCTVTSNIKNNIKIIFAPRTWISLVPCQLKLS